MSDEIQIDKQLFQSRLASIVSQWRSDKRAGDVQFGGVGSILILNGKGQEPGVFKKTNGFHVRIDSLILIRTT
jgi:hypothetical protein